MTDKRVNSLSNDMVVSLMEFYTAENRNQGPLVPLNAIVERVAAALKISVSTVKRIKNCVQKNEKLKTPGLSRPRLARKSVDLHKNVKSKVRNIIFSMYADKMPVTLRTLVKELADKEVLSAHRETIRKLLMNLGFKYKKEDNKWALMERSNIALMRINFFRKYIQNRHSIRPRQLVFLGETLLFAKESHTKFTKSVRQPEGYDGKRFIVLNAGTEKGFVQNVALIYCTKSKLADNHENMQSEIFLKWLREKFIPNLEEPSLIIMDNASHHSILVENQPTVSWPKDKIMEWLKQNNIPFNDDMFKIELLNLVKQQNKPMRYKVDELLHENGHEVLRLPPYHSQFNAIEMIWAHAKEYYNKHIGEDGYGYDKVLSTWEQALQTCSPELWKANIIHTDKVIDEWYNRERRIENIPEVIIHVGNDTDDESESDYSDEVMSGS